MQKNVFGPLFHTINKNELKMINNLTIRAKTIKLLGESIDVNLHDIGFGNGFLAINTKRMSNKRKIHCMSPKLKAFAS